MTTTEFHYGGVRGLKVPYKQPKRGRLWLNASSCIASRRKGRSDVDTRYAEKH